MVKDAGYWQAQGCQPKIRDDGSHLILQVTDNYTCEQYSLTPPAEEFSEKAWREMSPRLWLAGLRLRTDGIRQRARWWRRSWDAFTARMNRQYG